MLTGFIEAGRFMVMVLEAESLEGLECAYEYARSTNTMELHLHSWIEDGWSATILENLDAWRLRDTCWLMGVSVEEIRNFIYYGQKPEPYRGGGPSGTD
jgi:hypothetical protein